MTTITRKLVPLILLLAFPAILRAQELKLPPGVEKLASKAKETVEVNMDGPMLHWASKFLSAEDPEEKKAAKLVANLKGIYVRSYEFSDEGAYSAADVEVVRAQFRSPEWSRVVGVRSERDGDNVGVSPLPHPAKPQAPWILFFSNPPEHRASAMDQQGAKIAVSTFADAE